MRINFGVICTLLFSIYGRSAFSEVTPIRAYMSHTAYTRTFLREYWPDGRELVQTFGREGLGLVQTYGYDSALAFHTFVEQRLPDWLFPNSRIKMIVGAGPAAEDPLGLGSPNLASISVYRGTGGPTQEAYYLPKVDVGTIASPSNQVVDLTHAAKQLGVGARQTLGIRFDPLDRTSMSISGNGVFVEHDPYDILRSGAMTIEKEGPIIRATYSLGYPITLGQLAKSLGFDHFNWKQTVNGPGNWSWSQAVPDVAQNTFMDRIPIPNPALDMVVQRDDRDRDRFVIGVDGNGQNDVRVFSVSEWRDNPEYNYDPNGPLHVGPTSDTLPFYYSEFEEYGGKEEYKYIQNDRTVQFVDQPRVHDWALSGANGVAGTNFFMSFRTELVGVTADGVEVELHDHVGKLADGKSSLAFTWKSNAVFRETTQSGKIQREAFLGQGNINFGVPADSGGVFDVVFVGIGVPEPASSLHALSALVFLLSRRCCEQQRRTR